MTKGRYHVALSLLFALGTITGLASQEQVYKPGNGVTLPAVVHEVKPAYTAAAKDAGIRGSVFLKVVVATDGSVADVQVTQSLDTEYGLDEEAFKAMKQWEFKPGTKEGKAVPVEVAVEMTFTLK
jgi:TonB family protein